MHILYMKDNEKMVTDTMRHVIIASEKFNQTRLCGSSTSQLRSDFSTTDHPHKPRCMATQAGLVIIKI